MARSEQTSSSISDVTHESRDGILVIHMVGRAGVNVLMEYVMANLEDWTTHTRLLYDLSKWDVDALTTDSFRRLPDAFAPVHEHRGGRAALVISPHLEELAAILIALYEFQNLPVELAFFFDPAEARNWLEETLEADPH